MLQTLLDRIRVTLKDRWTARTEQASSTERVGYLSPSAREAYLAGYREGYWDGIEDLAEIGVEINSTQQHKACTSVGTSALLSIPGIH